MVETLVGTPDPPEDEVAVEALFLSEMAAKTDSELVAAYITASKAGQSWIHPLHVARILKLAAGGLTGR